MKKTQNIQSKKSGIILFLIASFVFSIYFLLPFFKKTILFTTISKYYQGLVWKTFSSNRVGLSFKYPKSWPVSSATNSELQESNKLTPEDELELESIDFQEEWNRAAGGQRLGWISVQKLKGTGNLDDYIKGINEEKVIEAPGTKFTVPAPEITFTTIGGQRAILVKDKSTAASFSRDLFDYRVVKDELLYRFVASASERFLEDKEKNSEIFQKIISTVKFSN